MNNPLVSIIIVNYNGEKFLPQLLESIEKQNYSNYEIIIVDNNSSDKSVELIKQSCLSSKIILKSLDYNSGFSYANNLAVKYASGPYILFLNSDTTLEENSIVNMVRTILEESEAVGIAPKIYLSRFLPEKILDSVGICIDYTGSPYNRGIGQVDFGQYDIREEVAGLCFAAALVNAEVYRATGGLDNDYFAYFEDVDWSFRTRKLGYKFFSAPDAKVFHHHSASTSSNSYSWKYYLIFRNYLRTVTKTFGKRNTCRIIMIKIADFLKMILKKNMERGIKVAAVKVVLNYIIFDWWRYMFKRFIFRRHFINNITDEMIFSFSNNEPSTFFNPITYEPIKDDMSLYQHVARRLIASRLKIVEENLNNNWSDLKRRFYSSHLDDSWSQEFRDFIKELT